MPRPFFPAWVGWASSGRSGPKDSWRILRGYEVADELPARRALQGLERAVSEGLFDVHGYEKSPTLREPASRIHDALFEG